MTPEFWDIGWIVLWLVFAAIAAFIGQIVLFVVSFAAIGEDKPALLILSIPLGLGFYGLAIFSFVQFIIQCIAVGQMVTA